MQGAFLLQKFPQLEVEIVGRAERPATVLLVATTPIVPPQLGSAQE